MALQYSVSYINLSSNFIKLPHTMRYSFDCVFTSESVKKHSQISGSGLLILF